jgi:dihydroflavonol-4-reductase
MTGVRWLFHVAADYRLWAPDPAELAETNVIGTRTVMEEAMRAGVERVVHTSSVATLAPCADRSPADETVPLSEDKAIGAYKRTKVAAERIVESLLPRGLPAVIVNPSTPVGPRDVRPTPTGRMILNAAAGRMPGFVDTGLNMVHVDDVASGHLAALERGRIGERYILGGQNASLRQILTIVAEQAGRRPPWLKVPRGAVFPIAILAELTARATGREPFATRDGLRMSRTYMFFSSAKAERELDYRPRPYAEGTRAAIDWFREVGYLR